MLKGGTTAFLSTVYRNYNELRRPKGEMTYLGHQKLLLPNRTTVHRLRRKPVVTFLCKTPLHSVLLSQYSTFKDGKRCLRCGVSKPQRLRQGFKCICFTEEGMRDSEQSRTSSLRRQWSQQKTRLCLIPKRALNLSYSVGTALKQWAIFCIPCISHWLLALMGGSAGRSRRKGGRILLARWLLQLS